MKNREIKFRAKRIQSHGDDWEFGHYAYFCQYPDSENKHIMLPNGWQIDENTLMQFTGLYDKNGKEIYEGDIVIKTNYGKKVRKDTGVVKYYESGACFLFYNVCYTNLIADNIELEVIGNIHQRPNLLK